MTAPGRTDAVGVDDLVGAIAVLTDRPTPRGEELPTATALARWASARWPSLVFRVDRIGSAGANLVCSTGVPSTRDLLIYSHLDTSLTGIGARDRAVTGVRDDAATGYRFDGTTVSAFGLGVARGPAAAALVGFASAAGMSGARGALRLVLAGGGTHENSIPDDGGAEQQYCGLETHLTQYPLPGAAVVAKAGPRGVLWDEPGAGYLRVRVSGERGAVLVRDLANPPGGLPSHLGEMCAAVERWREELTASNDHASHAGHTRQAGREVGIGAVRAGSTRKPDLLPAYVDLYLYVVMVAGDDLGDLAESLRRRMLDAFAGGPLQRCSVEISRSTPQDAGVTDPQSAFVRSATEVWERHYGDTVPTLSRWTGSTDGAVLRGSGVATVRIGPTSVTDVGDPAWDAVEVSALLRSARIYGDIARNWSRAD